MEPVMRILSSQMFHLKLQSCTISLEPTFVNMKNVSAIEERQKPIRMCQYCT